MSPDHRRELLKMSREAAAAFVEDLQHFREVLSQTKVSRGEIRRLSGAVRRILVDRDIATVAAPRLGRIMLSAPDNKEVYRFSRRMSLDFFGSAGVPIFGCELRGFVLYQSKPGAHELIFDPDAKVTFRVDNFLSQDVLCFRGQWVSRNGVIKYVANIGSGVHSGTVRENEERTLAAVRNFAHYSLRESGPHIDLDMSTVSNVSNPTFNYTPDTIDPVLVELLASIHFLVTSDDVKKLENGLKQELASNTPAEWFWAHPT